MDSNNNSDNNRNDRNNNNNGRNQGPKGSQTLICFILATVVVILIVTMLNNYVENARNKKINYNEFTAMIENGQVKRVDLKTNKIVITPKEGVRLSPDDNLVQTYFTGYVGDDNLVERLEKANIEFEGEIPSTSSGIMDFLLFVVLPIVFVWIFFMFMMRSLLA